jgi:hypothetical protein
VLGYPALLQTLKVSSLAPWGRGFGLRDGLESKRGLHGCLQFGWGQLAALLGG